jgi:hypothetical protein
MFTKRISIGKTAGVYFKTTLISALAIMIYRPILLWVERILANVFDLNVDLVVHFWTYWEFVAFYMIILQTILLQRFVLIYLLLMAFAERFKLPTELMEEYFWGQKHKIKTVLGILFMSREEFLLSYERSLCFDQSLLNLALRTMSRVQELRLRQ